jgi:hypothetical protein
MLDSIFDWSAISVGIATVAGWLPPMAALFSIIYLGFKIYDRIKYGPNRR